MSQEAQALGIELLYLSTRDSHLHRASANQLQERAGEPLNAGVSNLQLGTRDRGRVAREPLFRRSPTKKSQMKPREV